MKEETRKVYVTKDDKVFLNKKEAEAHERKLKSKKAFFVSYNPDLTEGRGYYEKGLITVYSNGHHRMLAEEWCNDEFGYKIKYVQGVVSSNTAMAPWSLKEINDNDDVSPYKMIKIINSL